MPDHVTWVEQMFYDWRQGCQIAPDFPPDLATLAEARCSQGCQIGREI